MGIIAGIGIKDTLNAINEILPEMDAILYKNIVGKNTLLDGMTITDNKTLEKGSCLLCGYRCFLDEPITLSSSTDKFVYGKLVLHFDGTTVDTFEIETSSSAKSGSNVNVTTITEAGTYYILLYSYIIASYVKIVGDLYKYPSAAYLSDISTVLSENGTVGSSTTGTTQLVNDNSTKIATTEYVHNQIVEEIDYESQEITVNKTSSGQIYNNTLTGTITLKRKAKYVIGSCSLTGSMTQSGSISGELGSVNQSFLPTTAKNGVLMLSGTNYDGSGGSKTVIEYYRVSVNPAGNISLVDTIPSATISTNYSSGMLFLGYEL